MMDMKYESKEIKDFSTPRAMPEVPEYPHGLKLHLGSEELKKLHMLEAPEVGKCFKMMAKVEVVEVMKEGEEYKVSLQIKEMELKKEGRESEEKSFYGE